MSPEEPTKKLKRKRSSEGRQDHPVQIWCSDEEWVTLKTQAKEAGLSISGFLLQRALSSRSADLEQADGNSKTQARAAEEYVLDLYHKLSAQ